MRLPAPSRPLLAALTAALLVAYPATMVAALVPSVWAFALFATLGYAAEAAAYRYEPPITQRLSLINVGITLRFVLRDLALIVLLVREHQAHTGMFVLVATGLFVLHGLRGLFSGLTLFVVRRRRLPVVTRGIDLSALKIPDAPHPLLTTRHTRLMLHLDVPVMIGTVLAVAAGRSWPGYLGMALAMLAAGTALGYMSRYVLGVLPLNNSDRVFEVVNEQLARIRPEVVLYFSGSADSAYQANMWLSTLDELDQPTLIILRERPIVPLLGRTDTPVVCVPGALDLVRLDLSTVRFAFFAANVGKNLHILRIPGIRSVFVNHGDSDKPASFNPFAKAYDEIWVAGPIGRERYLTQRTGVRDEDIVEVGRPQLSPIRTGPTPDPIFTVLYAPTWEGWSDDLLHSSVGRMGPDLVRMLLAQPNLRLLYKPHPLTGSRDEKLVARHDEIVALIEAANAGRPAPRHERLAELTRRLGALSGTAETGDELQAARDSGRPASGGDWQATEEAWTEAYWAGEDPARHRVVTGQRPHVYDCFNHCDLLVTDISSVAGDFIASGKPYAVTNVGGLDAEEFRALFPTAAAGAYLISPDCAELPSVLAEAQSEGPDLMADRRQEFKARLLGPDEPDSLTRFRSATAALIAAAEDRSAV